MTAIGALFGLLISVFLIIKKISPTYSLIAGAIVGGLLGGPRQSNLGRGELF